MALSTLQIATIASAAIAVGGVTAIKTGVVPNPFQTTQQEEAKAPGAKAKGV